jgi:hypothetical protein
MKLINIPTGVASFLKIDNPTSKKQYAVSLLFDRKDIDPLIAQLKQEYPDLNHKYYSEVNGKIQVNASSLRQPKVTIGSKEYKLVPNLQHDTVCSMVVSPKLRGLQDILFDLVEVHVSTPVLFDPCLQSNRKEKPKRPIDNTVYDGEF